MGYVAGRVTAERLVIAVATAYYGEGGRGKREELRPLIEIIDRASPGIVELGSTGDGPGFAVRLAERPFPEQYQAELRHAAEAVLHASPAAAGARGAVQPRRGILAWVFRAMRRLVGRASTRAK